MLKDVSDEIKVECLNIEHPKGLRLVMRHEGRSIGVLKPSGWDLYPEYSVTYIPHPQWELDDSLMRVYKKIPICSCCGQPIKEVSS